MSRSKPRGGRFPHATLTDVGRVRERNEDLAHADPRRGLFLLADGMGGHPDGNLAARIAIETTRRYLTAAGVAKRPRDRGQKLVAAIKAANRAILERAVVDDSGVGMGTTIVAVWLGKKQVHVAHVGDSRAYRIRDGRAMQLTRDHTVVQALLDRGDLAEGAPEIMQLGHILTQAVGLDPAVEPEVHVHPLEPGDVFLLCSDGLSDLVPEAAIGAIIRAAEGDISAAASGLVATALNSGGHDNVTVVLARNDQLPESREALVQ